MKRIIILALLAMRLIALASDPNGPSSQAMRTLSRIGTFMDLYMDPRGPTVANVYQLATNVINPSGQPQVVSAEKVLDRERFGEWVSPNVLLTPAYLKVNSALGMSFAEALKRHGSAFEICVLPVNQATNLAGFFWRTRDADNSRVVCRFPLMWVKRPELYDGNRPNLDIEGRKQMLRDEQFTIYWQAALDWYNRSRPLEVIDRMLAQSSDADSVLNGLMLLHRHPDKKVLQGRLEGLARSTNHVVVFHVIDELAEFKNERAVESIGAMIANPDQSRMHIARALGRTGQPKAVKPLERLLAQPNSRLVSRDRARIRMEIVLALAKIPTEEARDVLRRLSEDSDTDVSAAARRALAAEPPK